MDPCDPDNSGCGQRTTTPPKDSQNEQRISTPSSIQDSKDNPTVESVEKKLPMDSPVNLSPATNAASGRLVYVRRRVEVDTSKDSGTIYPATNKPKEPTLSLVSSSEVALSPVVSGAGPSSPRIDWEERYHHLQMLLNKLNESDQKDHFQMLWSLSSAELSKHAVELEKRSIHFSLEEAREMRRVAALNVLGKSVSSLKSTSNDGEL